MITTPDTELLVTMDLDEGQFLELGCLACHEDVRAKAGFAHPVRMYIAAINCPCGEEIVAFDVLSGRIA